MSASKSSWIVALCLLLALPPAWAEDETAPTAGPTPDETLMLEHMNRARKDPGREARRIRAAAPAQVKVFTRLGEIDFDRFVNEMEVAPSAQPLVFDLRLLEAARGHARYLVRNKVTTHEQEAGTPGFTGRRPGDRAQAAGYGDGVAENATRDYWNVEYAYLAFLIDFKRGAVDGMRPGRGHRKNILNPGFRVMASGRAQDEQEVGEDQLFSRAAGRRYVGGVVYTDANANGLYDPGEGEGGVTVRVAGQGEVRTWGSGAYALELPGPDALAVEVTWGPLRFTLQCPQAAENFKFDVAFPGADLLGRIDKQLEKLQGHEGSIAKDRRRLAEALKFHAETQGITLDDARREKARACTEEAVGLWTSARDELRTLVLDGPLDEALGRAKAHERTFRGTPREPFFHDAVRLATVRKRIGPVPQADTDAAKRKRLGARRQLAKVRERLATEAWKAHADTLLGRLESR